MDMTVTRKVAVLHMRHSTRLPRHVRFSRTPTDAGDLPLTVDLDEPTWLEMGEPDTITVTVVPGRQPPTD